MSRQGNQVYRKHYTKLLAPRTTETAVHGRCRDDDEDGVTMWGFHSAHTRCSDSLQLCRKERINSQYISADSRERGIAVMTGGVIGLVSPGAATDSVLQN